MKCPKCDKKAEQVSAKKIGGIPGNKYWLCFLCKWVQQVKQRKTKDRPLIEIL